MVTEVNIGGRSVMLQNPKRDLTPISRKAGGKYARAALNSKILSFQSGIYKYGANNYVGALTNATIPYSFGTAPQDPEGNNLFPFAVLSDGSSQPYLRIIFQTKPGGSNTSTPSEFAKQFNRVSFVKAGGGIWHIIDYSSDSSSISKPIPFEDYSAWRQSPNLVSHLLFEAA